MSNTTNNFDGGVRDRGIGVTIKYGKGYDDTWVTFSGTAADIRADICAFFGVECESVADLSLSGLVVNCTQVAHGKMEVASELGGVSIPKGSSPSSVAAASSESPFKDDAVGSQPPASDNPWAAAAAANASEPEAPADEYAQIRAGIEEQSSIDDLKRFWGKNQEAFAKDATLMDAYKARGQKLKSAAA